ncbi:hypothetical protein BJ973_005234 [Actinoplanes tereljensis]|uniref:Uncharacterized protein n=1 Tax=Paractinoplanes tereljensis TaxID=571912 RepID=A0A919TSF5_9ACTN|nr:hypothetical protein [Actinoplanes tereljensis]GIF21318.1 hypothetical protein Ate02nite_40480 [Actinoplanes tereljensis]
MKYGIYPGGRAGATCSRESDPRRVGELVDELTGGGPFVLREYVHFLGTRPDPAVVASIGAAGELDGLTMPDDWYVRDGRELDLVVSYLPAEADLPGWLGFLDRVIERYADITRYLQVTLEPNFPIPLIDGSSPGVLEALIAGLPHARRALDERGHDTVRIGFSVAEPAEWLGGDAAFWQRLAGADLSVVDYVGLGLYPDAFGPPVPVEGVRAMTEHALRHLREHSLVVAGIPAGTPIHVCENGSPSLPGRDQAASLEAMLAVVHEQAAALNITLYELFGLRDADTAGGEPVGALGLVTDEYQRKPAFDLYRRIVRVR